MSFSKSEWDWRVCQILTSRIQSHRRPHDHTLERVLYFAEYHRKILVCCLLMIIHNEINAVCWSTG